MQFSRLQLALGVGALTTVAGLGLYLIYLLVGDVIWYLALAGAIACSVVYLVDWLSETWASRKKA